MKRHNYRIGDDNGLTLGVYFKVVKSHRKLQTETESHGKGIAATSLDIQQLMQGKIAEGGAKKEQMNEVGRY
uniref:Uncharacterized protein n=1 Tax=Romanomermis culicivorax TaxID=13658 RepID=A0A915J323_ROMCU